MSPDFRRAIIREVTDLLGDRLDRAFVPWRQNDTCDLMLGGVDGSPAVLKIVVGRESDSALSQFAALESLAAVVGDDPNLRSPMPILNLREKSAFVMTQARGVLLQRQIPRADRREAADLQQSVEGCGVGLARIHSAWAGDPQPAAARDICQELLERTPWRLSPRERRVLEGAQTVLSDFPPRCARLHFDFDPCNILVDGHVSTILDPPDKVVNGPVHWDVATFLTGVDRAFWRRPWAAARYRGRSRALKNSFVDSYLHEAQAMWSREDWTLLRACELVRVAQLTIWWSDPGRYRRRLRGVARSVYAAPGARLLWRDRMARLQQLIGEQ